MGRSPGQNGAELRGREREIGPQDRRDRSLIRDGYPRGIPLHRRDDSHDEPRGEVANQADPDGRQARRGAEGQIGSAGLRSDREDLERLHLFSYPELPEHAGHQRRPDMGRSCSGDPNRARSCCGFTVAIQVYQDVTLSVEAVKATPGWSRDPGASAADSGSSARGNRPQGQISPQGALRCTRTAQCGRPTRLDLHNGKTDARRP